MKNFFLFLLIATTNSCIALAGDFSEKFMAGLNQYEKGMQDTFIDSLTKQDCIKHKESYIAALYFAIIHNKVKTVEKLFSLGASSNAMYGSTFLITTAINQQVGNLEDRLAIIRLFFDYAVNPELIYMPLYRNKQEEAIVIELLKGYKQKFTKNSESGSKRLFISNHKKWILSIGLFAIAALVYRYYDKNRKINQDNMQ